MITVPPDGPQVACSRHGFWDPSIEAARKVCERGLSVRIQELSPLGGGTGDGDGMDMLKCYKVLGRSWNLKNIILEWKYHIGIEIRHFGLLGDGVQRFIGVFWVIQGVYEVLSPFEKMT